MADEESETEGAEETATVTASEDAAAEAAIGDKMAEMFSENDRQNQADEQEQSGVTSPDDPDGLGETEEVVATDDGQTDEPTLEDLKAAKDEAAASGDFERAIELRDQIKELETVATPKEKIGVLSANDRSVMKDLGGWTDEDIETLEKSNPAFAKLTAKKLADGFNALSLQYAQAARNGAPAIVPQQAPVNATTQQQTATLEQLYKNLDKFQEIAGNDMVEQFIKPIKNEVLDPLKEVVQFVNEQKQQAIIQEVNSAVSKVATGGYEKHYGEADTLTDKQRENRQKLYSLADMIHVGAKAHKSPITYGNAINRAHLILTADQAQAKARRELVKTVKTRSTQITSRPSQRVPHVTKRGDAAAENVVSKFWQSRED